LNDKEALSWRIKTQYHPIWHFIVCAWWR